MTVHSSMPDTPSPQIRPPKHVPVLTQVVGPELVAQLVRQKTPPRSNADGVVSNDDVPVLSPQGARASPDWPLEDRGVHRGDGDGDLGLEPDALMAELYVEQLAQVIESLVLAELRRQAPALARDIALTVLPKVVSELNLHPKT
jgi:hypothetical protein